jgi:hypothetical protein
VGCSVSEKRLAKRGFPQRFFSRSLRDAGGRFLGYPEKGALMKTCFMRAFLAWDFQTGAVHRINKRSGVRFPIQANGPLDE